MDLIHSLDGEARNAYTSLVGKLLKNGQLGDQEVDGSITLRWMSGKCVVRMEADWN